MANDPRIDIQVFNSVPLGLTILETAACREQDGIHVHFRIAERPVGASIVLSPEAANQLAAQLQQAAGN